MQSPDLADKEFAKEAVLAHIRDGLQRGYHLFIPPSLYRHVIAFLRRNGVSEDEISRVRKTQRIPTT